MTNLTRSKKVSMKDTSVGRKREERISEQGTSVKTLSLKVATGVLATGIVASSFVGTPQSASACDCVDFYIVQPGDNLSKIGKKYGVSAEQLQNKNGFSSDFIKAGQKIIVPFLDESGKMPIAGEPLEEGETVYTIQNGDSLSKISKKFGVSVSKIKADNHLTSDTIFAGRLLTIKTGKSVSAATPVAKPVVQTPTGKTPVASTPATASVIKHIIKSGDTLWSLSRHYGVSVEKIMKDNKLQSATLFPGRTLTIQTGNPVVSAAPSKEQTKNVATATYTVQPGDTLYSLAKRFGSTTKEIRQLSGLKSDGIVIGQKLKIPARNTITSRAHIEGVVDSTSIEIVAHHVPMVLEVSYGSSSKYANANGEYMITFTEGSSTQRPALISAVPVN